MASKEKVVITCGDPAGCGPFIALEALKKFKGKSVDFFLVGDKNNLESLALWREVKSKVNLIDAKTPVIEKLQKGRACRLSGSAALNYLNQALALMKQRHIKKLVTAPLSKEAVQITQPTFSGHTEYLAVHFKTHKFAMMMASKALRVVLITRHISLRDVPFSLSVKTVYDTLSLVYSSLKKQFKIKSPKIAFAALNPHAGVNTFLGSEEKKMLEAIHRFQKKIAGPFPADTIFTKESLAKYDCILCAYHDQGMIPFKMLSFYDGVNVTLGLPIVRTSPAHGTAFDLVKSGKKPSSSSMSAAIELALELKS